MKQAFQFAPKTNPSKMNPKIICSKWLLLLLLLTHEQGRAKPVPNAQALSKWLEEDLEHPMGSEETESEEEGAEEDTFPWPRSLQEGLPLSESAFQRVFGDLLGSSRRNKGRSKKGLSRSCFGVKLDRIGALSGLGC